MKMERIIAVRNKKTIYRDGDRCVKVFHEDYSKADILSEALNQARIEETGLYVPRILEVTTVDGQWAIVSEFIKGKTLAQLMQENREEFEKYLTMFVVLQREMHSTTCPGLPQLKDKLNRNISRTGLDAAICSKLFSCLQSMPGHNQVCHGDFNPSNIIIAEEGKPYILDWAHAAQGDAAADAARTYLLFCLSGERERAEQYLTLYCQGSDAARQSVQKWLPIVAASQFGKGKADERAILLRWVNVVDDQ